MTRTPPVKVKIPCGRFAARRGRESPVFLRKKRPSANVYRFAAARCMFKKAPPGRMVQK